MSGSLILGALIVSIQVVSGGVIWLAVKRHRSTSLIEVLGIGLGLGTVLALIGSQLSILIGHSGIGWILPILVASLIFLLHRFGAIPLGHLKVDSLSRWLSVLVVLFLGFLLLIPGLTRTPLGNGYVTGLSYHGDLVFFEALAQSVSRVGPGESSLLADYGIKYHWFAYAWIGSLTDAIGAEAFVVMSRIFPVTVVVGAAFLTVAWAARLSRYRWTPLLAGLLVVVAGFVGAEQGVVLNFDSPSTAYAAVLALAFVLALTDFLRSESARWPSLATLAILGAGMTGAKVSQAAVVLVGLTAIVLVGKRMSREMQMRAMLALAVVSLAMVITYVLVLAGVATSDTNLAVNFAGEKVSTFQGLDPFPGALGGVLGSLALVLGIVPRWLGTAWLGRSRGKQCNPETPLGVGVAVAGLLPVLILSSGTNAGWFAVAASPILGVLSAVGLERAWRHAGGSLARFLVMCVIASVAVNAAVFVVYGLGMVSGAPVLWRGPVIAWIVALVLATVIAVLVKTGSTCGLRWLAVGTTILVLSSIGARFNGAVAWSATRDFLTPVFQDAVRWTDPSAELVGGLNSPPPNSPRETDDGATAVAPDAELAGSTAGLLQWSPELNDAALWLEPQVLPGELIAVDATYLQPFLPVVTDLTMYVAGEPYISGYTTKEGVQAAEIREERVRTFLEAPSETAAQALWADGVRWIWLQMTPQRTIEALRPWTSVARASDQVTILRLNDPGASSE